MTANGKAVSGIARLESRATVESWDSVRGTSESDWNATFNGAASGATRRASIAGRGCAARASYSHSCWSPWAYWRGRHRILVPFDTPRCPPRRRSPRRWPLPGRSHHPGRPRPHGFRYPLQSHPPRMSPPVPAPPHRATPSQAIDSTARLLETPIESGHRHHRRWRRPSRHEDRRLNRSRVLVDRQSPSSPRRRPNPRRNLGRRSRRPNRKRPLA
jgi:hypothetical protein